MSPEWKIRLGNWVRRPAAPPLQNTRPGVSDAHAAAVVDLALRTAELAVKSGALTSEAVAIALTVGTSYGLEMDVDVTFTSIIISYQPRDSLEPITGFRGVRERNTNYTILTSLTRLVEKIAKGRITVDQARAEIDHIKNETPPFRTWVLALGQGLTGAGVAAILGGNLWEMVLAAIANMLLYVVQIPLFRTQLSAFFIQAAGAAVPTAMGVAVMDVRSKPEHFLYPIFAEVSPSMLVATGIVSLLAGVGVVAAARDALDGNLITAGARTYDAVIQTAGIVVGVVVTLWAGLRIGVEGYIAPTSGWAMPSAWQILWAAVIAISVGMSFQLGFTLLPLCGALGALGFAAYQYVQPVLGNWPGAIAVGAFTVAFLAQLSAGRWRIPSIALVTTGMVSMMPGSMLYRGIFEALNNTDAAIPVAAQVNLTQAVLVGLALAAGSAFGAQVARPLSMPASWIMRNAMKMSLSRSRRRPVTVPEPQD